MLIPLIQKIPTNPLTYAVFFDGRRDQIFDSLLKARFYIHSQYGVFKDPTRYFFPSETKYAPLNSLDLFAFNLCLEGLFVDVVTTILEEQGPMHLLEILEITTLSFDISPRIGSRFLLKHIVEDGDFWISEEMLRLVDPPTA